MTTYAVYAVNELGGGTDEQLEHIGPFSFSRVLNGVGTFTGTVPLGLYDVTIGKRGIVVVRDGTVVWWGPVTDLVRDEFTRQVSITASESSWHLSVREMDDELIAYLDLATIGGSRTATWNHKPVQIAQDIAQAGIDMQVTASSMLEGGPVAGMTAAVVGTPAASNKAWGYDSYDCLPVLRTVDDLGAINPGGFRWRMSYSGAVGARARVLQMNEGGSGFHTTTLTVDPDGGLAGFRQSQSLAQSANRLHGLSQGAAPFGLQNDASLNDGDFLMARSFPLPEATPDLSVADWLRQRRLIHAPPANVVEFEFREQPGGMTFADCTPGGLAQWRLNATGGFATAGSYDQRAIAEMAVTVDAGETIRVTCMEST